jgi:2-amino-4-hydroxy-6-hydroxymethyldihydropteridine diphosphokinase
VDRERCYPEAVRLLASFGKVKKVSPVYETEPVGMVDADSFFNGALLLATDLRPEDLKRRIREDIEEPLGRVRGPGMKFQPRTIDVDIALWNDHVGFIGSTPVPDPDILKHLHVARPLADIAPDLVHPVTGQILADIAADLERACRGKGPLPVPRPDIILKF